MFYSSIMILNHICMQVNNALIIKPFLINISKRIKNDQNHCFDIRLKKYILCLKACDKLDDLTWMCFFNGFFCFVLFFVFVFVLFCFLKQSQSTTVYFICAISFFCQHFSALSTLTSLSRIWLDQFWPDLVTSTGWPPHLSHISRLGSEVT